MNEIRKIEYDCVYMEMAISMSKLSYAIRSKVGAIILSKNGQIISQGFNGTPSGQDNCCEEVQCNCKWVHGCCKNSEPIDKILKHKNCVEFCKDCEYVKLVTKPEVLHAESNAITKCAKWYNTTDGGTIYVTLSPCFDCAKLIIQSGIKRVVFLDLYRKTDGLDYLVSSGINVEQINLEEKSLKKWEIYKC